jgi:hypothetical protein
MLANLTHWCTNQIAAQLDIILAGHLSPSGAAQPVAVVREFTPEPAVLPEVYVQARIPQDDGGDLIGQGQGFDATGRQFYRVLLDQMPCDIGIRAKLAAERDDLFDLIYASLRLAIHASSGRQYREELWTNSGILVKRFTGTQFAPAETTMFGQIEEATTTMLLYTEFSVSVVTTPVVSVTFAPTATLSFSVGN